MDLPPREFAVLLTLALAPRVWPSYRLIPLLWPNASLSQCSCLKVYVHRLRRRLGKGVIVSTNRGYELDRELAVDLWQAEAMLRKPALDGADREALRRFLIDAHGANRDFLTRWEWFAGIETLVQHSLGAIHGRLELESRDLARMPQALVLSGAARRRRQHPGQAAV